MGFSILSRLTSNSSVLLFIIIFVAFSLNGPILNYMKEQKELEAAKLQLSLKEKQRESALIDANRWNDNLFLTAYARSHFGLIMPGEMAMHVSDPDSAGNELDLENFDESAKKANTELQKRFNEYKIPWYERIAKSFE